MKATPGTKHARPEGSSPVGDEPSPLLSGRRAFFGLLALGAAGCATAGRGSSLGPATPRLTEGPFYPDVLPVDQDSDLVVVSGSTELAAGEITYLTGRVLSPSGAPIENAVVEIWQVDHNGLYLFSGIDLARRDRRFQGYGRARTDADGRYAFRTIKPVPYPGRTPHIHVAVSQNGRRVWTTQIFINGHPMNDGDMVLYGVSDPLARETVLVDFKLRPGATAGELSAYFDIVLGVTPSLKGDPSQGAGASERGSWR